MRYSHRMNPLARCALLAALLASACTPGGVILPRDAGPGERDAGPESDAGPENDAGPAHDAGPLDCTGAGACGATRCEGEPCDGAGGVCRSGTCVPSTPQTETVCDDGVDEDEDGLTDCQDPDCGCGPQVAIGGVQTVRAFGGSGSSMATGACPAGQVIVGLAGASAQYLDRIQPVCAPLFTEDFLTDVIQIRTGPATVVSTPGGPAGAAFDDRCPDDMVVTRINVRTGTWLDSITARCEALFARNVGGVWSIYGDGQAMLPVRGGSSGAADESSCTDGAFTSIEVQYAQYVDRLTVECRDLAIVE